MRVVDPDGAGDHAHAKKHADPFCRAQVFGLRDVPQQARQQNELHGGPDQGDHLVPIEIAFGRGQIRVFCIQAEGGVQRGEQIPRCGRHDDQRPAAK